KRINDTMSHATGDTVLQHIGQLLLEATGETDIAARMGGEEFLLIFPGLAPAEAVRRCERLRMRIRDYGWSPITGSLTVTTSIGIAASTNGPTTMSAMLSRAD